MQHLVLYTVCLYCNIHEFTWSLYSDCVSPIHVFPIQRALKHCGVHKHIYIYIYIKHARDPKQS